MSVVRPCPSRRPWWWGGIVLLWTLATAAAAGAGEARWTTTPFFYWVGPAAAGDGPLTVTVDGEPAADAVVRPHGDTVHLRLNLHLEENRITIVRGATVLAEESFFYAPSYQDLLVPEEMAVYRFHTAAGEAPCRRCHRMAATKADLAPRQPADSICYPCHREEMDALPRLHPASSHWYCIGCHDPNFRDSDFFPEAPVRYELIGDDLAALCYRCHRKEGDTFRHQTYIHGPVGEGACGFCHASHGSGQPAFLHQPATKLCVDCHDLAEFLERPVVHPVLAQKGCTVCHDPHGSGHRLQLKAEPVELCFSCHPQIRELENSHPVQGHPSHGRPDPRDPRKTITCTSCHDPHGSAGPKLLAEEEVMLVCLRCHRLGE